MSALTERLISETISWDSRKELADIFQDAGACFPIEGLSDDLYSALLKVAQWGAREVSDVTEREVRQQVSGEISALAHTKEKVREHVRSGGSVVECDGYDRAIVEAANIAEGAD